MTHFIDKIKEDFNDIFYLKKNLGFKKLMTKYKFNFNYSDKLLELLILKTDYCYDIFNTIIIDIINAYIDNKINFKELQDCVELKFSVVNNEKKIMYNKIFPEFINLLIHYNEEIDEDKINNNSSEIDDLTETEFEDLNELELLDYDDKIDGFNFRENQKDAINKTIEQNFKSGIHCQIMGAGKTFIMLNIIYQHWLKYKKNLKYIITTDKIEILKSWFMIEYNEEIIINRYVKKKHIAIFTKEMLNSKDYIEYKENYEIANDKDKSYIFNYDRFQKWTEDKIINMNEFNISENIIKKSKKTLEFLNKNLEKPTIWICNNAFLKTKEKYKKINLENMGLILVDECHSISGKQNFDMLEYFRNKNINIQGFSATPLRPIKNASDQLLKVYGLTPNKETNELNVISNYDMIKALKDGVILPFVHNIIIPEIHKDCIKIKSNNKDELTLKKIFEDYVINNDELPYKKCPIWANAINKIAKNKGVYYNELKEICGNKIKLFVSYSGNEENKQINEISEFEKCDKNAFLLCVNRIKEGSDIKNLDCGIFLDAVKKRSIISSLQSMGRIMRPDKENKKKCAYIIECVKIDAKNKDIESITVKKVLDYYRKILNISSLSKSIGYLDDILKLFDDTEIINEENKNILNIKINNNINLKINIKVKQIDWRIFQNKLRSELKTKLKLDEIQILKREFLKLKYNIKGKYKTKNEYLINETEKNPEEKYKDLWTNWYDFLSLETNKYPKTKEEFCKKCCELNITTVEMYNDLSDKENLPLMPNELYKNFTTLYNELKINKNKRR
jgi:superfamily II DNA or RNA helicase